MPDDTKPILKHQNAQAEIGYPSIDCDHEKYRNDISECGYTAEQENQVLQALWEMMVMMADLGWGADSVQMLLPALFEKAGADSDKSLQLNISEEFNPVANDCFTDKEASND